MTHLVLTMNKVVQFTNMLYQTLHTDLDESEEM